MQKLLSFLRGNRDCTTFQRFYNVYFYDFCLHIFIIWTSYNNNCTLIMQQQHCKLVCVCEKCPYLYKSNVKTNLLLFPFLVLVYLFKSKPFVFLFYIITTLRLFSEESSFLRLRSRQEHWKRCWICQVNFV